MNTSEYLVPICGTVIKSEIPWNVQMSTPILKQEIPCIDVSSSNSSGSVYISEHLQSPEYVNYYDTKVHVLEEMKKEFRKDNEELELIHKEVKLENTNENISLDIKEKDHKLSFEINIKSERQQQEAVLVNDGDISEYSDELVALREIEYKFVRKKIKNSINKHNNEVKNEELGNNETHGLHKCQYCDERFENYNIMLVHITIVHNNEKLKCELCVKQFKKIWNVRRHLRLVHADQIQVIANFESEYRLTKHRNTVKNGGKNEKGPCICDSCGRNFNNKHNLTIHKKRQHYDYGKTFDCWCGKQFRTPTHLSNHNSLHRKVIERREFKCKDCEAVFHVERYLTRHIKRCHSKYEVRDDQNQVIVNSEKCKHCNAEFESEYRLAKHRKLCNTAKNGDENEKRRYICDYCGGDYKEKHYLSIHIKRMHYDYGKSFDCWCGKLFRSPIQLKYHNLLHRKITERREFKCKNCDAVFHVKQYLMRHIKRCHSKDELRDDQNQVIVNSKKFKHSNAVLESECRLAKHQRLCNTAKNGNENEEIYM